MTGKLRIPDSVVAPMWADYQSGMSLSQVARKYNRNRKSLGDLFRKRGLQTRYFKCPAADPVTGKILRIPEPTDEELQAIIAKLKSVTVPKELKVLWRRWPMEKRGKVIQLMREHLKNPHDRPQTKFSKNVIPFDYCTPEAIAIAKRENAGRNSQTKKVQLKPACQGVIYKDRLWYWAPERNHGAYYLGVWTPENGRPSLHHTIWEEHNGPVPESMTVVFKDGNRNNLTIRNLALKSRRDLARENSVTLRLKADPTNPRLRAILAKRTADFIKNRHERSRNLTNLLLTQHNSGQRSMAAQLK